MDEILLSEAIAGGGSGMKTVGAYKLPDEETAFNRFIEKTGGWQLDHLETALTFVPEDRCGHAVDCGASFGSWSLRMAWRFRHVYAFEPAPEVFECLVANTKDEPRIQCFEYGLGEKNKLVRLVGDPSNTGARYIAEGKGGTLRIEALDSLHLPGLDFLKVDVEGYETFVLRGARETISKFRPVIIIEDKGWAQRYGLPHPAPIFFLESLGMKIVHTIGYDTILVW